MKFFSWFFGLRRIFIWIYLKTFSVMINSLIHNFQGYLECCCSLWELSEVLFEQSIPFFRIFMKVSHIIHQLKIRTMELIHNTSTETLLIRISREKRCHVEKRLRTIASRIGENHFKNRWKIFDWCCFYHLLMIIDETISCFRAQWNRRW